MTSITIVAVAREKKIRTWIDALVVGCKINDAATQLFAKDALGHESYGERVGREAIVHSFCIRMGVLARHHFTYEFVGETESHLALSYRIEGVQIGLISGLVPTGNPVWFHGISTYRFDGDFAVEYWDTWDLSESLMDAGILAREGDAKNEGNQVNLIPGAQRLKVSDYAHLTLWAQHWQLSVRQAQLGALLLAGISYKAAGAMLGLTDHTVRSYLRALYAKANVRSHTEFMNRAIELSTVEGLSEGH